MAVDPVTLKIAAKAAFSILIDEDSRKKAVTICATPAAIFVLLISLIVHIATMPFAWLSDFFLGDQYDYVQDFRIEHGYDQLIASTDESYLESAGLDFSGISFTDGVTEVFYYNQLDARWKDLPYGITMIESGVMCSVIPNVAFSLAIRKSQESARSTPPPKQ